MPIQRTFLDVLSEINGEVPTESFAAGWESSLEPAWLSQLVGTVSPIKFQTPYIYRYGRTVRKAHVLDADQAQAFAALSLYQSTPLHPGFSRLELKSAYRAALLKTHPDQGGTAESFQQVRKSYEILVGFVTK